LLLDLTCLSLILYAQYKFRCDGSYLLMFMV